MNSLVEAGINFFNSGHYFEAHEAWEDLWRGTSGPLRLFYQGLVQSAVGLHHLSHGNINGARAQLTKSLEKLEQYPEHFCKIDNGKLVAELRGLRQDLVVRRIRIVQLPNPLVVESDSSDLEK